MIYRLPPACGLTCTRPDHSGGSGLGRQSARAAGSLPQRRQFRRRPAPCRRKCLGCESAFGTTLPARHQPATSDVTSLQIPTLHLLPVLQVALVQQLFTEVWAGPGSMLLNPEFPARPVPEQYAAVCDSVLVVWSFLPIEISVRRCETARLLNLLLIGVLA